MPRRDPAAALAPTRPLAGLMRRLPSPPCCCLRLAALAAPLPFLTSTDPTTGSFKSAWVRRGVEKSKISGFQFELQSLSLRQAFFLSVSFANQVKGQAHIPSPNDPIFFLTLSLT